MNMDSTQIKNHETFPISITDKAIAQIKRLIEFAHAQRGQPAP